MIVKLRLYTFTITLMLMFTYAQLFSQIVISGNDILLLKGTTRTALSSMDDSAMVTIGSGGINQTWDYRNINTDMFIPSMLEYFEPGNGFRAELYHEANFRQRISTSTEDGSFLIDSYMLITSDNLISLGTASDFAGFSFTEIDQNNFAPLPMSYGTNWVAVSNDTTDQIGLVSITTDSTWNTVDGSGTLRLPFGDIECLRLREMNKTISNTTFNGTPIGQPDTTTLVSYFWLSKAHLQTFIIDSIDAGMGIVNMMISGEVTSVVGTSSNIRDRFILEQNYPNPFNPTTTIQYSVPLVVNENPARPAGGYHSLQLKIYDVLGREVSALVNEVKSPGTYEVKFDASQFTSGIYFYTIKSGKFVETKKMLLMK